MDRILQDDQDFRLLDLILGKILTILSILSILSKLSMAPLHAFRI